MEGAFASVRDKEGGPFMPQTVLLRLEADRGFGTTSDASRSRLFLAGWIQAGLFRSFVLSVQKNTLLIRC
jgi:hypothetical protein